MDVLVSGSDRGERPLRPRQPLPKGPLALAAVMLLLLGAEAAVLARSATLPDDVRVEVLEGGYVVTTLDRPSLVTFQLRSTGRPVQVRGLELAAPGLELTDAVVSGEAVGFRRLGEGPGPLPPFELSGGATVVMNFAATDCAAIDDKRYPVRMRVTTGLRRGTLPLPLRDYPDLTGNNGPDLRWQQVLGSALCR